MRKDGQVLHRARQRLVTARTRLTNQLRAVLIERGIILPKRRASLVQRLDELMDGELPISARALRLLGDLRDEWASLDKRIKAYDDELAALTRDDDQARRLATSPGIGVINATALRRKDQAARHQQAGQQVHPRPANPRRACGHGALRQAGHADGRLGAPAGRACSSQRCGGGTRREAGAHRVGRAPAREKL